MKDRSNSDALHNGAEHFLNTARGQQGVHLHTVPPAGAPEPAPGAPPEAPQPRPGTDAPPAQPPTPDPATLSHAAPSRQRLVKAYLAGEAGAVMQSYAPNAKTSDVEGWVEDYETVHRLAKWRSEATY